MVQSNYQQTATKKASGTASLTERKLSTTQKSLVSAEKSQKKIATIIAIREGSVEPQSDRKQSVTPKKSKLPTSLINNIQQKYQNKQQKLVTPTKHERKKSQNKEKIESNQRDVSQKTQKSLYKAVTGSKPMQKRAQTPVCTFYAPSIPNSISNTKNSISPKSKL